MESKDDENAEKLESKYPPPGIKCGQVSAEDKANNAGRGRDPPQTPKANARSFPSYVPVMNVTVAGRISTVPIPSNIDQPTRSMVAFWLTAAMDVPTPYIAAPMRNVLFLQMYSAASPDQHEGCLHQGVDGDDGLDGEEIRVQVICNSTHGYFHGGRVNDQDECCQADDEEDSPPEGTALFH